MTPQKTTCRTFFAATAATAVTAPLTASQASIAPDPAIEAVQALKEAEKRLNTHGASPEVVAFWAKPPPSVTVFGVEHTDCDDLDAHAVAAAYRLDPSERSRIIATYALKKVELVEAKRARKELERGLFEPVEAEYDKAYELAMAVRPTTPVGAAALLSIIDTDEPFVPNIIAALEGMKHG